MAELLRCYGKEKLEIVDARAYLPNFRCRPGLQFWHVLDDAPGKSRSTAAAEEEETNGEEGPASLPFLLSKCEALGMKRYASPVEVPSHRQHRIRSSCFPPTPEEAEWMHLGTWRISIACISNHLKRGVYVAYPMMKIPGGSSSLLSEKSPQHHLPPPTKTKQQIIRTLTSLFLLQ